MNDFKPFLFMTADPHGLSEPGAGCFRVGFLTPALAPGASQLVRIPIPFQIGTHGEIVKLVTSHNAVWIFGLSDFIIDGEQPSPSDVIGHPLGKLLAFTCTNLTLPATGDAITVGMRGFVEVCVVND